MRTALIIVGGLVGAAAGCVGATYLAFVIWGDGQVICAGLCPGIPLGASLGVLAGRLIARKVNKR